MGRSAVYSICLHLAVLLTALLGIPDWLKAPLPVMEKAVVVEILDPDWLKTIQPASTTNLPQKAERPQDTKKPEQQQESSISPFPPSAKRGSQLGALKTGAGLKSEPRPRPESPPSLPLPLLSEPSELPRPELKPKSELRSEPKILEQLKPALPKTDLPLERKDRKEARPDNFDVLLKNVEKLVHTEKRENEDRKTRSIHSDAMRTTNRDFDKTIATLVGAGSTQYSPDLPLSLSEIDGIRAQIERCWNVPTGARGAENLIIEINVQFTPNGQVLHAQLTEDARYHTDRFYQAAADSAKRAVYQCSPIKAPPMKYDRWREVKLRFNPREMFGP